MYALVTMALVVALFFAIASAIYFYKLASNGARDLQVEPFNQFLVAAFASAFALFILFLFYLFVGDGFEIKNNMGQVGDFVGGLTNPVLSFIGLVVLLRTTLIQTNEARKTSVIMLEQQKLFEQERFESAFFILLERYETAVESHFRLKDDKDKLTRGLRVLQDLRKKRIEFDGLPIKTRIKEVYAHVKMVLNPDRHKKIIMRVWQVFHYINRSKLPLDRKKYYFLILIDSMEPCEVVIFLSAAFLSRTHRKNVRLYSPSNHLHPQFFVTEVVHEYFKTPRL
ncbi:hypothetical protein K9857_04815 [Pseudomonas sp. REP124]|uniref:hypothetical protein n=1 Tax=Pseudomonas sp. REP124 TaxID=2875731 RepID=UPI001CCC56FC|nr:hypothetical protein [Pseudomonas sp. REP124]MBZ9780873.1 hypothetical protein [Pseudomonas sp. REP124]